MFPHSVKTTAQEGERENLFILDLGALLQIMSDSGFTPEEQETIQKSKDPSAIMTANGCAPTTEKKQS